MIDPERNQKIETYGNAYYELHTALEPIPREMWHYKPAPNRWSIHEIIIHLADGEANYYVRFRKGIAESGKPIMPYDQESWAQLLEYSNRNADEHLEMFKWLRSATYAILRGLPNSMWQNTVFHPERGVVTLESLLDINIDHVKKHIAQIRLTYEQWRQQYQHQNV